jgi:hypothetical protein
MKIIELIIDEENEDNEVSAISLVERPAIEENWVALNSHEVKFAQVDKEKRIILGAALVPNKPIFRKGNEGEEDYYIFFSESTIEKASQRYFINGNQSNATLEHKTKLEGLTVVESWLIKDKDKDKSRIYGLDLPVGSWVVAMKVNSDEIWNDYVLSGKVLGFSVEAFFTDPKAERPKDNTLKEEAEAQNLLDNIKDIFKNDKETSKNF